MLRTALAALTAISLALPAVAETQAQTPKPAQTTTLSSGETKQTGLVWRCGKNNPAMWGTFGNGCLKQKRAYKKKQNN